MKRREFIKIVSGAAIAPSLVWSRAAGAQGKIAVVGVLVLGRPPPDVFLIALRDGLSGLGYAEGQNIRLEIRNAEGEAGLLAEMAAELVRLNVDIVVAYQTQPATAAKKATREIPIVMASVGDPVGTGLVVSLARPGGNVTGTSAGGTELAAKTVELIREVLPSAHRLAVLANETDPFTRPFLAENDRATRSVGMAMEVVTVRPEEPLERAFATMIDKMTEAVIIQGSLVRKEAVELAMKHRLPMFSASPLGASLGCLASYTGNIKEIFRETAGYIDKILRGGKPADIPVSLPTRFNLVINLKTAKALRLDVPPALLARADEVID